MSSEEEDFEILVLKRLDDAEAFVGSRFVGLRKLIQERGAVSAAVRLLDPAGVGHAHEGFVLLAKNNLVHLSIEQAVIDCEQSGLFPQAVVWSAKARLLLIGNYLNTEARSGDEGLSGTSKG